MAGHGRIREEDVVAVRERAPIETVVSPYATLKRSGTNLVGLCPFHDERSGSFSVDPGKNVFFCHGCGAGGDVIGFVQQIDHLTFVEAVEYLAPIAGISLRYEDGGQDAGERAAQRGQRARLLAVNAACHAFYVSQLMSPEAAPGRQLLADRAFTRDHATQWGCGYAPYSWDATTRHLRGQGFTDEEIVAAGIASQGKRGAVDRFRGRLIWPIRDTRGEVLGFGARRLRDDDGPKFLNTPETSLYRKSRVMFGLDMARMGIVARRRVVVVEGYADVMACHIAGETTAVATSGTAFGEDHVRVLRRLLDDSAGAMTGEVIFAFDGDTAGQKAALKAYNLDARFQTRTYAAVAPAGLDPCDLRLAHGDQAIHDLVAARVPLFEVAIRATVGQHDLTTAEGRVNALAVAAPIVASIRDDALRGEYVRDLIGAVRLPADVVHGAVGRAAAEGAPHHGSARRTPPDGRAGVVDPVDQAIQAGPARPDPADRTLAVERQAAQILVQEPGAVVGWRKLVTADDFTSPAYQAIHDAVEAATAAASAMDETWVRALQQHAEHETVRALIVELAMLPPLVVDPDPWAPAAGGAARPLIRLAIRGAERRAADVEAAMQDPDATEERQVELCDQHAAFVAQLRDLMAMEASMLGS